MNPKEKAKDLEVQFLKEIPMDLHLKVPQRWELRHEAARKCALICVNEMLEYCPDTYRQYWTDVQQEIKKNGNT